MTRRFRLGLTPGPLFCPLCFTVRPPVGWAEGLTMCRSCDSDLSALRITCPVTSRGPYPVMSLYHYRGLYRRLLLQAKIKGDQRTARLLINQAADLPQVAVMAAWAEAVVPCPSSLWGRARGRLDLAAALAQRLSELYALPVLPAPAHLFWRLKKRARMRQRPDVSWTSSALCNSAPLTPRASASLRAWERAARNLCTTGSLTRILIVDDVTTTGHTLIHTASALLRAASATALEPQVAAERSLRFFTLAAAHSSPPS